MIKEGYIKFSCEWIKDNPISVNQLKKINKWRDKMYHLGLIGCYDNGIGFGNISVRLNELNHFIITGSATGRFKSLNEEHYTKVTNFNLKLNSLICRGPIKASSESLTHAVIYQSDQNINAIIHVHNLSLWEKLLDKVPTTSKNAEYGTPEMAEEMVKLFEHENTKDKKIIVMGGHQEGVISFGKDLNQAGGIILNYFRNSE